MNWRDKTLRFSIRRLKVAVASVIVGMLFFGTGIPTAQATSGLPAAQVQHQKGVSYRYVLESELTEAEKQQIIERLPSDRVGQYETYYMVYRPVTTLPKTGSESVAALGLLGAGFLLVGVSLVKGKKKLLVTSLTLLGATGAVSVSALGGGALSAYDHGYQLAVGSLLPETVIAIPNHEFVGYLLYEEAASSGSLDAAVPSDTPISGTSAGQHTPNQPVVTTKTEVIDVTTQVLDDPDLPVGEEVVVQEGRQGLRTLTYHDGQLVSSEVTEAPQPRVVKKGSRVLTGTVEESRAVALPFDTKIVEDPTQYTDYSQETPGQEGQAIVTETYQTVHGVKYGLPIASRQELVTAPVDRVITVGTKPIQGETTEVRYEAIAPAVEVVKDTNQYEDYYHEVPGTPGQLEITETYLTLKGQKDGLPIASSQIEVTPAVATVVTVGQKPVEGTTTTSTVVDVPYDTRVIEDDAQYTDYYHETPGQVGQAEVTETYQTVRGEVVGDPIDRQQVELVAPVAKVVVLGSKPPEGQVEVSREETLLFETTLAYDHNQYDDYVHETGGQTGLAKVTETFKTFKGEAVGLPINTITEEISAPVANVRTVGTKPIQGTVVETETVTIDFKTIETTDPDQYTDYEAVRVVGETGSKTITTTYQTVKGVRQPNPTVTEQLVKPVVNQVVVKGTKPIEGEVTKTRTEPIDFSTREIEDDTQYTDYRQETGGVEGVRTITEVFKTEKGQLTTELLRTSSAETTAPVDKVITVGTKPIEGEVTKTRTEPIAFTTREIKDPEQYIDYRKEEGGVEGVRTITEVFKTEKGQLTTELLRTSSEETTAPIDKVITIGTKPIEGEVTKTRTEPIAFTTREVKDPEQYTDYRQEEGGVEGVRTITEVFKTEKDRETGELLRSSSEETTAPVDKVITIGIKPIEGEVTKTRTELIAFTTREVKDSEQYTDYRKEEGGVEGVRTITEVFKTEKGRDTGELLRSSLEETTAPVDKIITVGTKPISGTDTVVTREQLAYGSREVKDADKYEDYREVTTPGQIGEVEVTTVYPTEKGIRVGTPTESRRELTPAVDEVITIGTKPIEGEVTRTRTEPIAFTTREVKDPDQYTDYRKEEGGVEGVRTITEVFKTEKGQLTTELLRTSSEETTAPVAKVITIGTKPISGTVTVETTVVIPFKEEIQEDATKLATEADEVIQAGKDGSKIVSAIYKTERGQQIGDPISQTEQTILEPENRIIKRGTRVLTEAEKQDAKPAVLKQTVEVGQEPIAKDSVDSSTLTKVKTYAWKTGHQPSTTVKADNVAGLVLVTYEDDSVDEVAVTIDVVQKKTKPVLELEALVENDDDRTISLNYKLTDPTNAKTGITFGIYDGDRLVKEAEITSFEVFEVDGLDWDVPYTLKTTLSYDLGDGVKTETLPDKPFELEYKKLEIKDVDSLGLYRLDNGQFVKQETLAGAVTNPEDYFVRVTSDRFRDMLLPVKSIAEETQATGGVAFRVTTDIQELVEDKDASANSQYQDQFSFLVKKTPTNPNALTSFKALVDAIKANASGHFVIGADLYADDVTVGANDLAYITTTFKGSLTGLSDGQRYAIHNLKVPLFNRLEGASISQLDLKNVTINTTRANVGTVANDLAANSRLTDVSVQGNVTASHNIGGLVNNMAESVLDNTSFTGRLTATSTATSGNAFTGGLAATLTRGTIQNSYVNADITVTAGSNDAKAGGIVGFNNNGYTGASFTGLNVRNVYTQGSLTNKGTSGQVGGIVGSNEHWGYPGRFQNVVNNMTVTNGNPVYGFTGVRAGSITEAYTTTGTAQPYATVITAEAAEARQATMGITTTLEDSIKPGFETTRSTDYTQLPKATADRAIAYDNIEKLMPFYHKEFIVKYGNLVDASDKLYTTKLLSVTPMVGDKVVSDVNSVKTDLNRLMLHYADNTVAYLDVSYTGDFKNKAVSEYAITGTKLIYTPEQFLSNYDGILNEVLPELEAVSYKSMAMVDQIKPYAKRDILAGVIAKARTHTNSSLSYIMNDTDTVITVLMQVFRMSANDATTLVRRFEQETIAELTANETAVGTQMDKLYLEPTFNAIKADLAGHLRQILATDKAINTSGGIIDRYVTDFIKANKERLLLGLAYMNRWYNIDFQKTNIKDLAAYHQDFFGKQVNTLEWLVNLGSNYETLLAANNVTTHASHIAPNTTKENVLNYLTYNRQLFTDYADDNTWFKETSKAYIAEQQSKELPNRVVRVYDTLSLAAEQNGILPLLTAREGIFIITSLGGITYGMFDRYYDDTSRNDYEATPALTLTREEKTAKIKEFIDRAAKRQGDHFDVWYRLAPANVRDALVKPGLTTWDGYRVRRNWLPMYGSGANEAILDFFGPVGDRASVANNGTGAYATGTKTAFVNNRVLDNYGMSVYTHEVVHNNDGGIYLGGFGRREGMGAEAFPLGLLQSSSYGGHAAGFITLNLAFDFEQQREARNRDTNVSPERFKTAADLKEYMHGVFDVLYTLDYAEAQAAVSRTTEQKQKMFGVIENVMAGVHAGNRVRALTTAEAETLTSWDKFIDANIIGRREYPLQQYNRNGYYHSYLFSPNYAALSNDTGAPGDLMFRRIAFELMADKGYEEGFIPYTSNKLKPNARTVLTDQHVLQGVYGTTYATWADFKKAMFQERIAKLDRLSATSFTYLGRQVTINSFDDLQTLMADAVAYDAARTITVTQANSRVHSLKAAIYNAYLRQSDDFRQSIFN